MIAKIDMKPISPKRLNRCYSADHVVGGIPIPKPLRISTFSPEEWEVFVEEWASSLESSYCKVERFGGSGDQGVDIVGYIDSDKLSGGWDNYQCKQYKAALTPSDIWVELGKVIYYSFKEEYSVPRKHYFVAPRGVGTKLGKLLAKPEELKKELKENWDKYCKNNITSTCQVLLQGDLLRWFDELDFSIFSSKSAVELVSEHAQTPFHAVRFGGGLPIRPDTTPPPDQQQEKESRYIQQIFDAYSDYLGQLIEKVSELSSYESVKKHFLRQRENFYHAESLRNFARDTVPDGTFENLQEEIFHGVIDVCESEYNNGYERMKKTVSQAGSLSISANPLASVTYIQDKQGICHQLASEDRLIWVVSVQGV